MPRNSATNGIMMRRKIGVNKNRIAHTRAVRTINTPATIMWIMESSTRRAMEVIDRDIIKRRNHPGGTHGVVFEKFLFLLNGLNSHRLDALCHNKGCFVKAILCII